MYRVEDGQLWWDDDGHLMLLGPADAIYVDGNQKQMVGWLKTRAVLPEAWLPFIIKRLPVGDYVFISKGNKIVGIEAKTTPDFHNSYYSRRLQRQSRNLLAACDIAGWGLQLLPGEIWDTACLVDVYKWQACGGLVFVLPWDHYQTAQLLVELGGVIREGKHLRSILAGTDDRRIVDKLPPCATALRRLFTGIGPAKAVALDKRYKGDIIEALQASDEEWRECKVYESVLRQRRELMAHGDI